MAAEIPPAVSSSERDAQKQTIPPPVKSTGIGTAPKVARIAAKGVKPAFNFFRTGTFSRLLLRRSNGQHQVKILRSKRLMVSARPNPRRIFFRDAFLLPVEDLLLPWFR